MPEPIQMAKNLNRTVTTTPTRQKLPKMVTERRKIETQSGKTLPPLPRKDDQIAFPPSWPTVVFENVTYGNTSGMCES